MDTQTIIVTVVVGVGFLMVVRAIGEFVLLKKLNKKINILLQQGVQSPQPIQVEEPPPIAVEQEPLVQQVGAIPPIEQVKPKPKKAKKTKAQKEAEKKAKEMEAKQKALEQIQKEIEAMKYGNNN